MSVNKITPKEWFSLAKDDLEAASILYGKRKYRQSIFFLQQSNELTLKGLLLSMGFIPFEEESEPLKAYRKILGLDHEAKDFGHIRHDPQSVNLLTVLEYFYENVGKSRKLLPDDEDFNAITDEFEKNRDEVRERIEKAKALKENSNPTIPELEGAIKISQQLLLTIRLSKNAFFRKYLDLDKQKKKIVTQDAPFIDDRVRGFLNQNMIDHTFLIFIAYLFSFFLSPHLQLTRYPDNNQKYDRNQPLIKRFHSIEKVFKTALKITDTLTPG